MRRAAVSLCLFVLAAGELDAAPSALRGVGTSPGFFNPAAGQRATISLDVAHPGRLRVAVLDRDRVPLRLLADHDVDAGAARFIWDGRDDAGAVVPDEVYTLRIELAHAGGREVYDPAAGFTPLLEHLGDAAYSRVDGTLSYRLARPSRVHIQAGQAWRDPETGAMAGPILKTVLDRVPRVAGAVVESWSGMDASGQVYVPDLPHFAVAVLASSLPESSLITVGNRRQSFADYVRARGPAPRALPAAPARAGAHHAGLTAREDRSPALDVQVKELAPRGRRTPPGERTYAITARLAPGDAPYFVRQPTRLLVYLDDRLVLERERPRQPIELTVARQRLSPGSHRLVVNWGSEYGPVAVGVARLVVPAEATAESAR